MKNKIILGIIGLLFVCLANAQIYETELDGTNIINTTELNYTDIESNYTWGLYYQDFNFGNVTFDGRFITDEDSNGYFYGNANSIGGDYESICLIENNWYGCLVMDETESHIIWGAFNESTFVLLTNKTIDINKFDVPINESNIKGDIRLLGNNDITVGYGDSLMIINNTIQDGYYNSMCYQVNNESIAEIMEKPKCILSFVDYLDLDGDNFTSDIDCNDYNSSINPNATEVNDNSIDENCDGILGTTPTPTVSSSDSSSPSKRKSFSTSYGRCVEDYQCDPWSECYDVYESEEVSCESCQVRICSDVNHCNREVKVEEQQCMLQEDIVEEEVEEKEGINYWSIIWKCLLGLIVMALLIFLQIKLILLQIKLKDK